MSDTHHPFVYKLIAPASWHTILADKLVPYSDLDKYDGFMHLSAHDQYMQTANLHYTEHKEVLCLVLDIEQMTGELKLEAAKKRDGALFPHLFGTAPMVAIKNVHLLKRQPDGTFLDLGPSQDHQIET